MAVYSSMCVYVQTKYLHFSRNKLVIYLSICHKIKLKLPIIAFHFIDIIRLHSTFLRHIYRNNKRVCVVLQKKTSSPLLINPKSSTASTGEPCSTRLALSMSQLPTKEALPDKTTSNMLINVVGLAKLDSIHHATCLQTSCVASQLAFHARQWAS